MSQISQPDLDVYTGNWQTPPVYSKINDTHPHDETFVSSEGKPEGDAFKVHFKGLMAPQAGDQVLTVRMQKVGTGSEHAWISLVESKAGKPTMVIAARRVDPTDVYADYSLTLTSGEAKRISDYACLYLRVSAVRDDSSSSSGSTSHGSASGGSASGGSTSGGSASMSGGSVSEGSSSMGSSAGGSSSSSSSNSASGGSSGSLSLSSGSGSQAASSSFSSGCCLTGTPPSTLHITISETTGSCVGCFAESATLFYESEATPYPLWDHVYSTTCRSPFVTFILTCTPGGWLLTANGCNFHAVNISQSCSPINLVFHLTSISGDMPCCADGSGGTMTVTITE